MNAFLDAWSECGLPVAYQSSCFAADTIVKYEEELIISVHSKMQLLNLFLQIKVLKKYREDFKQN
jgi:hypothetical protein